MKSTKGEVAKHFSKAVSNFTVSGRAGLSVLLGSISSQVMHTAGAQILVQFHLVSVPETFQIFT